jgi:hypothetical protein
VTLQLNTVALYSLAAGLAGAADPPDHPPLLDKSRYSLFDPTPRALLREMSADRPDKTESAYTVDAGHFQLEMDIAGYTHDRSDAHTDALAIAPMNLKLGLLNTVDFQLMLETFNWVRKQDPATGATQKRSGFGDVATRLKVNLWGDDGGTTALAVMPFVVFPTSQDYPDHNAVAGGIIFPLAVKLPLGWDLGAMTEFDLLPEGGNGCYHASFINTITFAHGIVGRLGGYLEFFSEVSTESGAPWIGTADVGLTYQVTDNLELDAGINVGLTRSADDLNVFTGLSWRF